MKIRCREWEFSPFHIYRKPGFIRIALFNFTNFDWCGSWSLVALVGRRYYKGVRRDWRIEFYK